MLAMMIPDMLVEGDIFVEGGGFADVFSADLLGFLVPTMYHPLFGSLVKHFDFDHSVGQQSIWAIRCWPWHCGRGLVASTRSWRRPGRARSSTGSDSGPCRPWSSGC